MEEKTKALILHLLGRIAPEADLKTLNPNIRFRDQFDFDSVDFLNFSIALQEELKIEIPETDYPRIATLNGCIDYVLSRQNVI